MVLSRIPAGKNPPTEMTVVVEVPEGGNVKYEIDKSTGLPVVDRILHTPLSYPTEYGYFPNTLGDDGDPLDAVVVCNAKLRPGVMINVRPIGALLMEDQAGMDEKIICVPTNDVDPFHANTLGIRDLPEILKAKIEYFFRHYKDLEPGKWVKLMGWADLDHAHKVIVRSIEKYNAQKEGAD
jgi:inorganic pyrophosphatase